jgi:hypothetical protein
LLSGTIKTFLVCMKVGTPCSSLTRVESAGP